MSDSNGLIKVEEQAGRLDMETVAAALSRLKNLDEVIEVRDQARLLETYARQRNLGVQAALDAAEMRVRAERRLGELLAEVPKRRGGWPKTCGVPETPQVNEPPSLAELGIDKNEARRARALAKAPAKFFEETVALQRQGGELSVKAVIRAAQRHVRERERMQALKRKAKAVEQAEGTQGEAPAVPEWDIVKGDCIEELGKLRESPRLIFGDPPYNIGIDYGDGVDEDLMSYDDYVRWAGAWVSACYGALSPDGSLWVMIGDEYAAEYNLALKRAGFTIRSWIKWYETFGVNCTNKFNRTSRHIFYAVKDPNHFVFNREAVSRPSDRQTKYNDPRAATEGKLLDDVWADIPRLQGTSTERVSGFPTQLPLRLLGRIVRCASDEDDLVLDPFSGSATTGVAAVLAGRRYLGIEEKAKSVRLSRLRMKGEANAAR